MAYLSSQYEKVRRLNGAKVRSEVWLVSDAAGRPAVMRVVHAGGMPFALLREHQGTATPFWPEIFFCAEDEDETIVVEEYVSGHTLEERRVARQWLTEAEARSLLAQAAAGLAALHALGIVHRDIKPAHLIVQPGGSGASGSLGAIRLIDFDAARIVTAGAAHDTHRLGTEGYAPPEQFGYGQTDGRSECASSWVPTLQKRAASAASSRAARKRIPTAATPMPTRLLPRSSHRENEHTCAARPCFPRRPS